MQTQNGAQRASVQHWYALYTKSRREHQVQDLLRDRGFEAYLPLLRVFKKGRLVQTRDPLFPCYIFSRFDLAAVGISAVSWVQGLRRVVSFCGEPAVVDDDVIACIKKRLSEGSGPEVQGRFKAGDRVIITKGPFKDLEAIFDNSLSASQRVRVLLKILGQRTPCEVDIDWIKKAA